jgi:MFS family permease
MSRRDLVQAPYGWRPAAALTAVNFVDGAEGAVVIGALSLLQDEWGFSDAWAGAIATAAAIAGLVALLPAGWMADHLRRTRVLGLVLASWAVLTTASAAAVTFWMFFLIRVVLGAAMHVDNPPASSLLADSYAPALRGRVFGYQRVAFVVGTGVGIGIGGAVGDALGWRAAFLVMVIPGLVVAALCWRLPEPERGALERVGVSLDDAVPPVGDAPRLADQRRASVLEEMELGPLDELETGRGLRQELARVREVLRIPTVRHLFFGLTVAFLGFNGIAFWLPTFLERTHDLSESAAAGMTAVTAIVAGLGGSLLGGIVGDRRERRRTGARVDLVVVSLAVGGVILIGALLVPMLGPQVLAIGLAAFVLSLSFANFAAATADVLPAHIRGTGFAVFTFLLTLGSALGPLVVGGVSDATGSLGVALAVAVVPTLPGAWVVARARTTVGPDSARARATLGRPYPAGSEPTTPT